jgi:hypothetical protein
MRLPQRFEQNSCFSFSSGRGLKDLSQSSAAQMRVSMQVTLAITRYRVKPQVVEVGSLLWISRPEQAADPAD